MSTAATWLKELHRLHVQLREIQEKLEGGPRKVKARQQFALRKEAERDEQKAKLTELKKGADQKNLQLRSNEAKITELRAKLNAASSNREFDIIKGQIDADTMANSVLEDEILELLDKVDRDQGELARLEQELAAAKAEHEQMNKTVQSAEAGLKQEISGLESVIREAEKALPADVIQQYRRLVQAHGPGALAAVDNGVCTSCHVSLLAQSRVELNSGKVIFCKNCGRLLYLPESE